MTKMMEVKNTGNDPLRVVIEDSGETFIVRKGMSLGIRSFEFSASPEKFDYSGTFAVISRTGRVARLLVPAGGSFEIR
jgi:hypothetical protein